MTALARVVCTCPAVPAQWNAWTVDGQYLYLRYRFGRGTVDAYDSHDPGTWGVIPDGHFAEFRDPDDPWRGEIDLDEFLSRSGLRLAPLASVVSYEEYAELRKQGADVSESEDSQPITVKRITAHVPVSAAQLLDASLPLPPGMELPPASPRPPLYRRWRWAAQDAVRRMRERVGFWIAGYTPDASDW